MTFPDRTAWRRIQAEKRMVDSCTLARPGSVTQDAEGGYSTPAGTPVTVRCLSSGSQQGATLGEVGGQRGERGVYQWVVPVATDVQEQDTLTYSGRAYVVIGAPPPSALSAERTVTAAKQ